MGAGIAGVAARAQQAVVVVESSNAAADAALDRLRRSLERAEAKRKIASAAEVLDRIQVLVDLGVLADREVVVEAIVEDETAKVELFKSPLALADLIGLDTTKAVAESLYEEFKEPLYAAPPLLQRMVRRAAGPGVRPRVLLLLLRPVSRGRRDEQRRDPHIAASCDPRLDERVRLPYRRSKET